MTDSTLAGGADAQTPQEADDLERYEAVLTMLAPAMLKRAFTALSWVEQEIAGQAGADEDGIVELRPGDKRLGSNGYAAFAWIIPPGSTDANPVHAAFEKALSRQIGRPVTIRHWANLDHRGLVEIVIRDVAVLAV